MKTKFEKELEFVWTDGGNSAKEGYFDGAGDLNHILQKMFAGHGVHDKNIPFSVDVMGDTKYGAKVNLVISLEIEE